MSDEFQKAFDAIHVIPKASFFIKSQCDIDRDKLQFFIEDIMRTSFKRWKDDMEKLLKEIKQEQEYLSSYELPDSTPAEQLAKSCFERANHITNLYIEKANEQDKKMNELNRKLTKYLNHKKKFELTLISKIESLEKKMDEITGKKPPKKININIRQKPSNIKKK